MNSLIAITLSLSLCMNVRCNTFIWDPTNPSHMDISWKRGLHSGPTVCVDIPSNLSLCNGIRYNKMRLPNLLQHDSVNEIIEQSNSWTHLVSLKCHPDTQLFLCSLFSPVCLEQIIPPCRSLCEDVKNKCETYMQNHGYSWPPMMRCEQFPIDNNMCIQSQTGQISGHHNHHHHHHHNHHSHEHHHFQNSGQDEFIKDTVDKDKEQVISKIEDDNKNKKSNKNFSENIIDSKLYTSLMSSICKADWVIKSPVNGNLDVAQSVRIKNYKTLFGNFEFQKPLVLALNQSSVQLTFGQDLTFNTNRNKLARKQRFVLIGNGKGRESDLSITRIVAWQPFSSLLKKTVKNAKRGNCVRFVKEESQEESLLLDKQDSRQQESEVKEANNQNSKRSRNRGQKKNRRGQKKHASSTTTITTGTITTTTTIIPTTLSLSS